MTARSRSFNSEVTVSGRLLYIVWKTKSMTTGEQGTCDDHIGNYPAANPLSILRQTKYTPLLNGELKNVNGKVIRAFEDCPPGYWPTVIPDPRTKFPLTTTVELNDAAWEILAKSNPSLPHVNVPASIGELKDLPSLVRGWGRGLVRNIAQGHLTWQWALKPMASDISKLMNFTQAVDRRLADLRRLRDGKGMRKRVSLGSDRIVTTPTSVLLHSEGATIGGTRTDHYTVKRWGSVTWKVLPDSVLKSMSDDPREGDELKKFTQKTMAGVNGYGALAAAWELCPWSWLIDWFSNVGTMISATNNAVGCTWSRSCYMKTSECRVDIQRNPLSSPWATFGGDFNWKKVRKERYLCSPVLPVPLPHLPIITGRKLSILAALAALRR